MFSRTRKSCELSATVFFFFFLFVPAFDIAAQQALSGKTDSECIPKPDILDGQKVFRLANTLAHYPGGDQKMLQYIQENFRHAAGKHEIRKTIVITFVVDTAGRIRNACIGGKNSKNSDENTRQELVRVFTGMPRWDAAVLNGKKSYMRIVMPVQLVLD